MTDTNGDGPDARSTDHDRERTRPDGESGSRSAVARLPGRRGTVVLAVLVALALVAGPTAAATVSEVVATTVGPVIDGSAPEDGEGAPADPLETGPDESVVERHVSAVVERGSATTTLELRRTEGANTVVINRTARVDFGDRALFEDNRVEVRLYGGAVTSDPLRIQQYRLRGETYTRTTSSLVDGNYTQYDGNGSKRSDGNGSKRWTGANTTDRLYTTGLDGVGNLSWTRTGTEQYEGTEVVRYEVAGVDDFEGQELNLTVSASAPSNDTSRSVSADLGNVTVTDASATLLVDHAGVVRHLEYNLTVLENDESVTYVATLSVSDLGETTVPRPAWANEANATASGGQTAKTGTDEPA